MERKRGFLRRNESRSVCVPHLLKVDSYGLILKKNNVAAYVFGIIVYLSVTVTSLRAISEPTTLENYEDQAVALRVLSAGNIIIIGSLLFILALQVRGGAIVEPVLKLIEFFFFLAGRTRMGTSTRSQ